MAISDKITFALFVFHKKRIIFHYFFPGFFFSISLVFFFLTCVFLHVLLERRKKNIIIVINSNTDASAGCLHFRFPFLCTLLQISSSIFLQLGSMWPSFQTVIIFSFSYLLVLVKLSYRVLRLSLCFVSVYFHITSYIFFLFINTFWDSLGRNGSGNRLEELTKTNGNNILIREAEFWFSLARGFIESEGSGGEGEGKLFGGIGETLSHTSMLREVVTVVIFQ